jgi:ribosome biogenesis GTPase
MPRSPRQLDEDDVRVRPGRGSRPRSKDRPSHADAVLGSIVTVDRGRFTVHLDRGETIYAIKARELGRKGIVVGDRVHVVGDRDDLARIVRRDERTSALRRTADDADPVERIIVANADQLAIVTATTDPEPSTGLIDRALIAAFDARVSPLLVVTKTDLHPADELIARYAPLGIPMYFVHAKQPTDELRAALRDQRTVLMGHSGVGKSTLVNALVPNADRVTGAVNAVTGKGRHTSTSALLLPLTGGGAVIDTPGIRSFGLAHVAANDIVAAFPDLAEAAEHCPRSCTHDDASCALDSWATTDDQRARVASLRTVLRSLAG